MGRKSVVSVPPIDDVMRLLDSDSGREELKVELKVVTPMLGGCYRTREIDKVDIIRVPGIRGQLRFWWRALYAHEYSTPTALFEAESKLWGGVGKDTQEKSAVDVAVGVTTEGVEDKEDVRLFPGRDGPATEGAYALFPAKSQNRGAVLAAPRRKPGTRFSLTLRFLAKDKEAVKRTVGAFILFGGVGGRTRRGLGALEPMDETAKLLAVVADYSFTSVGAPTDVASLRGAKLLKRQGNPANTANEVWLESLKWLQEFRQGVGTTPNHARKSGLGKTQPSRPSVSRWPEADVMRVIYNKVRSHPPSYRGPRTYPRAQFGLPIIGQWQSNGRDGERYDEPPNFTIRLEKTERLASPLIVKPLWIAGQWFAMALWLNRSLPAQKVGLAGGSGILPNSVCDMSAWPEHCEFDPLNKHKNMRDAFCGWLTETKGATELP